MLRKAAAFMLVCALASSGAAAQDIKTPAKELPRIASTSLCGDSYLLAIAQERIGALSWQSRDKISRAPARLKALPQAWDSPEYLAGLKTPYILFGPGEGFTSEKYITRKDRKTQRLVWGEDFASVAANIALISEAFNTQLASKTLSQKIDRRLSGLKHRRSAQDTKPKILYLSRSGATAGPGTYVNTAIEAAGGQNVVTTAGWVTLDPEKLIALAPDVIVTSFFSDGYESINAKGLRHKVLGDFITSRPRIDIPGALWPCAGPGLIEAAEMIADGLDKLP